MFECHVTINPVFDRDLEIVEIIAAAHKFKLANLQMQRRKEDTPERSKFDTFMTGHDEIYTSIENRLFELIKDLQSHGYEVWRYKIEKIILDSKKYDIFNLINHRGK